MPFEKDIRADEADGTDLIVEVVLGLLTSTAKSEINSLPRRTPRLRLPGMGVMVQVSAVGRSYHVRADVYHLSW